MKRASISHQILPALPLLVLAAAFLVEFLAILARCEGHFVYSLDDAYIHLALAERIAAGHYGINWGEASAPSSSILWPFLLAPFAQAAFYEYLPLMLNGLCAAATVWIYGRFFRRVFAAGAAYAGAGDAPFALENQTADWRAGVITLFTILLIAATNQVGLAFTGMEHSLQVLLSVMAVYGLIILLETGAVRPWFFAALVLAPLVRYECLALVIPILGVLLWRRKWAAFGMAAAGLALGLGAFSFFLDSLGLGWLPTSIAAKSVYLSPADTALGGPLGMLLRSILMKLFQVQGVQVKGIQVQGIALLVLVILFFIRVVRAFRTRDFLVPLTGLFLTAAHFVFGTVGWWDRYEVYVIAAALLLLLYHARGWLHSRAAWPEYRGVIGLLLLVSGAYIVNFFLTPLAAANIYEQQYQMHRFVVDVYRAPVAVNDLGWVAYRNPNYVLDLWGLASKDALTHRMRGGSPAWMDEMAKQKGVRLVMIYDEWIPQRPSSWRVVARLHLGQAQASVGGRVVTFYAVDETAAREVREDLQAFAATLPAGVRLEVVTE